MSGEWLECSRDGVGDGAIVVFASSTQLHDHSRHPVDGVGMSLQMQRGHALKDASDDADPEIREFSGEFETQFSKNGAIYVITRLQTLTQALESLRERIQIYPNPSEGNK